jgi:hypothetical protein
MKPLPPPTVAGTTEAERFSNAVRKMFTVPKATVLKQEAKQLAQNRRKRARAKKSG